MENKEENMDIKQDHEPFKDTLKRAFSLSEDSASNDEIRSRLLDGGTFP